MLLKFLLLTFFINFSYAKRQIPIGAIFHDDNSDSEIAFRYAIKRVNMYESGFELVPLIRHISASDSFKTERIVCEFLNESVVAIFGPGTSETSGIASSICNAVEIPHIIMHWEREKIGKSTTKSSPFTLNLFPDTDILSRAYAELLIDYTWKSYTIIYEDDDSLMRLKDILQIHDPQSSPVTVRQLGDGPDYRPLLKSIQTSGESHIILDVGLDKIITLLRQASEVKMMEEYQSYIIISLDTHTLDFEELKFMRANITAMRLIDPHSHDLMNAIHDWELGERQYQRVYRIAPEKVMTETGLYHDAVRLFAAAVRELDATEEIETEKIDCKDPAIWEHGKRIVEYMRLRTDNGITGRIIFNEEGKRTHFQLEITELSKDGFKKIGTWDPENQVSYTRSLDEAEAQVIEALQNKTFVVVSRIAAPFLDYRVAEEGELLEGNNRFQGYSLDLIDAISKVLHFNYRFELVPDGKYGSYNKDTKQWDGLVRHLLDRKADLAICDLTITYERRTAVDFTMPFMTLGISILFLKPVKQPPDLFSFLSPLSVDVWIYMFAAYLSVSVLLFVLARMAPDDWESSHPCNQEPEELENIWNMHNCIWLTMGSIMGQGCDILPKAISTRLVCGIWWFFALIMLASYTANLAAFLTMERMDATINSAEDLAKQSKIKYGAVKGGSTMKFFQESNFSTYQRMWAAMESARPSVFTNNNDEGRDRVLRGKRQYAYLMESTMLEYFTERYCELTQIGGLLDSKSYGIALPLNSPYRTAISGAVLKLQEDGKLSALKEKWWKGGKCQKQDSGGSDDAAELGIANVGGVFVVLGFGCLFALIVAILEFLWNVKKVAVEQKLTPWEALKAELLFAINIWIVTKPVHNRLSESESRKSTTRSPKSVSRYGSDAQSNKEKSEKSVNLNNGKEKSFTSRSLSHLNRIGKIFTCKNKSN
ncbi:hypothetical protein PVAND_013519 [Polypedilum vanderplanki]|uniref:Glutamate receptor 1 n=1 Tax=Polypedilum vanderplanki TaxID=319348 RepID=A0A9J6CRU0_POLVA|nr:hypothetical protein PVAND_013519 [Polypedilum vanderplanki]